MKVAKEKYQPAITNVEKVEAELVEPYPPAKTPLMREQQCINLSYNLAEKQLRDGTASAAVIVHFLKLGDSQEKTKQKKIEYETELLRAKTESIQSGEKAELRYEEAIAAMKKYSGNRDE